MKIYKVFMMGIALAGSAPSSTSLISLSTTRLQTVCSSIKENVEQNKDENSLPKYSEHYTIMSKINTCLKTLSTSIHSYLYLNSANSGVLSTNADGSDVVLTQFPSSGGLSLLGLVPEKIRILALAHSLPAWPTDALTGCSALESVTAFGEELKTPLFQVVRAHFEGCPNLKHIQIPSTAEVGDGVRENLGSVFPHTLQSVVFPSSTRLIGRAAFCHCEQLVSADLSKCDKLQKSNGWIFDWCYKLTSVDLSNCKSLTTICTADFEATPLTSIDLSGCTNLQTLRAFSFTVYRSSEAHLTSIVLPSSLKEINSYVFEIYSEPYPLIPRLRTIIWKGCSQRPSGLTIGSHAFGREITFDQHLANGTLQEIFVP